MRLAFAQMIQEPAKFLEGLFLPFYKQEGMTHGRGGTDCRTRWRVGPGKEEEKGKSDKGSEVVVAFCRGMSPSEQSETGRLGEDGN